MNDAAAIEAYYFGLGFLVVMGVLGYLISPEEDYGPRRWMLLCDRFLRRTVNRSSDDYVTHDNGDDAHGRHFRTSHAEVETEAARKLAGGSDEGIVVLTQNALQNQIDDATQEGMIRAFAVFQSRGYIPAGKATEIKKALFLVGGGRKLQALNAAIDAVVVPDPPPEPARVTPVAHRPVPNGQRFAGDALDDKDEG